MADVDLGAVSKRENAFWLFFSKKKMLRAGTLKMDKPAILRWRVRDRAGGRALVAVAAVREALRDHRGVGGHNMEVRAGRGGLAGRCRVVMPIHLSCGHCNQCRKQRYYFHSSFPVQLRDGG